MRLPRQFGLCAHFQRTLASLCLLVVARRAPTADLAYAEAKLGNFKQAKHFSECTVQVREPVELPAWAQGATGSLKKKELPKDPPPRVKGRKWNQ